MEQQMQVLFAEVISRFHEALEQQRSAEDQRSLCRLVLEALKPKTGGEHEADMLNL